MNRAVYLVVDWLCWALGHPARLHQLIPHLYMRAYPGVYVDRKSWL